MPPMTPIPRKTIRDCFKTRPIPPIIRPKPKNNAATVAATRGPRRSTQGPPKAALIPNRTSAVVKVVYGGLNHDGLFGNNCWIGRLNVLHAYTDPMQMCTATAPNGMNQRLNTAVDFETAVSTAFTAMVAYCISMERRAASTVESPATTITVPEQEEGADSRLEKLYHV